MRLVLIALPLALLAAPPAFADSSKPKVTCTTSAPATGSRLGQRKCVSTKAVAKAEKKAEPKVAAKPAAKPSAKAAATPGTQTAKR